MTRKERNCVVVETCREKRTWFSGYFIPDFLPTYCVDAFFLIPQIGNILDRATLWNDSSALRLEMFDLCVG
jgi:hypothetical protein